MRHVLSRFDDHAVFEPMLGVRSSPTPTLTSTTCFMHMASLDTLGVDQGRVQTTRAVATPSKQLCNNSSVAMREL